jgi:mono/diheme cytochrome c family protein
MPLDVRACWTFRRAGPGFWWALSAPALILFSLAAAARATAPAAPPAAKPIDFARQIRPILSQHCFACHGPDDKHRKAGLRLDTEQGARKDHHGTRAIVPGNPSESEAYLRLVHTDPDERMPPPETGKTLSPHEIALIRTWIEQGAGWAEHWSFRPLSQPEVPPPVRPEQARNAIDHFVLARLAEEGLEPSPPADAYTLIRRLALDLTGLPPTVEDADRFAREPSDQAYEALVERYLASAAYGERWARVWLDLARYADSRGYEKDKLRTIWRYRDWVIEAFNRDLPYTQFTIEQLAGDLLPRPTSAQLLATAFHRNTLTNDEGGTDDEEFRVAAVKDRVDTTLQVWMGLTAGCAKCHEHKYDPLTQKEYYQLYAFFNQTEDADRADDGPTRAFPTPEQERARAALDQQIAALEGQLDRLSVRQGVALRDWERAWRARWRPALKNDAASGKAPSVAPVKVGSWYVVGPFFPKDGGSAFGTSFPPEQEPVDIEKSYSGGTLKWRKAEELKDGAVFKVAEDPKGVFFLTRTIETSTARVLFTSFGGEGQFKMWLHGALVGDEAVRSGQWSLGPGEHRLLVKIVGRASAPRFFFEVTGDELGGLPVEVARVVLARAGARKAEDVRRLREHFLRTHDPRARPIVAGLDRLRLERDRLTGSFPLIPIVRELPSDKRRETRLHVGGNFLDQGEPVLPNTPAAFHPFPEGATRDRLGLAHWLVNPQNPLTARVAVNRHWAQFFGVGLAQTEEDFGGQGLLPSHPELLDWLASEFVRQGWSFKRLCKTIVMSATYRQSARATPALLAKDKFNRLLARGPRFRLEAEMIRDSVLAASGLLSGKLLGPSVMPPQPPGIWAAVYSQDRWVTARDEDRWRRGLYTFVRRTSPYPSMVTFDAPSREVCAVRRIRSNTPLQALVTLNDPVFVEAAQALARRMLKEVDGPVEERIARGFRLAVLRPPAPEEVQVLAALYRTRLAHARANPADARALATEPLGPLPEGMDPHEAAALTAVANVLLNMDEVLTKG